MCGIACLIGGNVNEGKVFADRARVLLKHRGPDDSGVSLEDHITLVHLRLSILDLTESGHQPMSSSCGRYKIVFNGEIYNHQELRKKYLSDHPFRGHSDTETIIELFRLKQEKMLTEMVGMWAIAIYDTQSQKVFVSRDRYGQKPVYVRRKPGKWMFASEVAPLITDNETLKPNATAVVEFLALGNYGHLGTNTFFEDIKHFPQGCYAWVSSSDNELKPIAYWTLPDISKTAKQPFTKEVSKQLHDVIVEAVLSQTLSDVPIGVTLSGGIDSSIITGILSEYYNDEIHVFSAQSPDSKFDETDYVTAVIKKCNNKKIKVHMKDLNSLSIQTDLEKYIRIQEEPFGDPSIIAHGFLMEMAAREGIKVILNGQGADEVFFGYNNLVQAILPFQLRSMQLGEYMGNMKQMKLGQTFFMRTVLQAFLPNLEYRIRKKSRAGKRHMIADELTNAVQENSINMYPYTNLYNVWKEAIYGVQLPHLVHYDDRNGMANSIEGRMPFLDHRIAELVATIQPSEFIRGGMRKFILREACRKYLPDEVYNRTDKIGFFTPLQKALVKDTGWVQQQLNGAGDYKQEYLDGLMRQLNTGNIDVNTALYIWRNLSTVIWRQLFHIK